ncbi:wsv057 [White spot syndrome virus]|uniref:Wsv057 n=3 Tax=White spot syndrome virus TaxID=342409 RepID=Q8VBB4_WSSVS|nr:wsv057 [Shrimp white spot syndrome virus]AFX59434.1 wsv057 [White spot syndrome virus]AAL33061.1 wsv057 [Shrimp white spot syndrome virus]AAL88982.1 WSSV114 [Shrimp white spot syndrome virus]AWQ60246.1 wsv057 [Shrimp white spot syndrome virus]AWQ60664.1 wsv057 [Shrimp white spot syndrome virus]
MSHSVALNNVRHWTWELPPTCFTYRKFWLRCIINKHFYHIGIHSLQFVTHPQRGHILHRIRSINKYIECYTLVDPVHGDNSKVLSKNTVSEDFFVPIHVLGKSTVWSTVLDLLQPVVQKIPNKERQAIRLDLETNVEFLRIFFIVGGEEIRQLCICFKCSTLPFMDQAVLHNLLARIGE